MTQVDTKTQAFVRDVLVNLFKQETSDEQVNEVAAKIDATMAKKYVHPGVARKIVHGMAYPKKK